jgi:hypothetical protein
MSGNRIRRALTIVSALFRHLLLRRVDTRAKEAAGRFTLNIGFRTETPPDCDAVLLNR